MVHAGHFAVIHTGHVTLHGARAHASHLAVVHTCHITLHSASVHPGHLAVIHAAHAALHAAVVHARHAAVIHTHVAHGDQGARIGFGYWSAQPFTCSQSAAGIAGAIHGLGKNGVSLLVSEFDNHVVSLGHGDAQLINADWLDVQAIGRNNRHLQAWNAHVEVGHGRAVNEAQTELFARFENTCPVPIRCLAIHQVGVGVGTYVG